MAKLKKFDFDFRWKDAAGAIVPEKTAIAVDGPFWASVPEKYRAMVTAGDIVASVGFVKATAKLEDEKGKKTEKSAIDSYARLAAQTPQAALFLMDGRMQDDGKLKGVLSRFNYGYDLAARTEIRNPLLTKLEGPEKAIEKGMKGLIAMGMGEAEARAIATEQHAKLKAAQAAADATADEEEEVEPTE